MKRITLLCLIIILGYSSIFSQQLKLAYSTKLLNKFYNSFNLQKNDNDIIWGGYYKNKFSNSTEKDYFKLLIKRVNVDSKKELFSTIVDAKDHLLLPISSNIDSNGNIEILSSYAVTVSDNGFISNQKPHQSIIDKSGVLISTKCDSMPQIKNLNTVSSFLRFKNKYIYIYDNDTYTINGRNYCWHLDSSFNVQTLTVLDTIPSIDSLMLRMYSIKKGTDVYNDYAYIGGQYRVSHLADGIRKTDSVSFTISKIDSSGKILWTYVQPGGILLNPNNLINLQMMRDGSLLAVNSNVSKLVSTVLHISSSGQLLNEFDLYASGEQLTVVNVMENNNSDIVVVGYKIKENGTERQYWIAKYKLDGTKMYSFTQDVFTNMDNISNIVQKDENTYYVSSVAHQDSEINTVLNILEFSDSPSGITENSASTSAYWNGYSITVSGANNEEIEQAELYDITGCLVASQNGLSSGVFVPNTEIETGAYILQLSSPKGKTAVKVMVR